MRRIGVILALLVLTPVICVGALFFIKGPNGEALMNMDSLRQSLAGERSLFQRAKQFGQRAGKQSGAIGKKVRAHLTPEDPENFIAPFEAPEETLFKWRGKDGKWHFSNQLPLDREEFEVVD